MNATAEQLRDDFVKVACLAGVALSASDIAVEVLKAPHQPPTALASRKMAAYVFLWRDRCLKVGKAGPKSQARYVSQHYNPASSRSNLARSILEHRDELDLGHLGEATVGDWIKGNTTRANFIMDRAAGVPVLGLLESFLQCRLQPMFEGFESQR